MQPIYLDNAASTHLDPDVAQAMTQVMQADCANAASAHAPGRAAAQRIEQARAQVAALIGAQPREIVFTSGATESNNLALKGMAAFYRKTGGHIVSVATEHRAVLDPLRHLQGQGWRVTRLDVDRDGRIDLDALAASLTEDTVLVSVMHVNNETGVVQDLAAVAELCRGRDISMHTDAAQSLGKLALDVAALGLDLASLSAHKLHGPKGIGALYVRARPRAPLLPQIHGGGHEAGLRAGTLATHQIVGMGMACAIAQARMAAEQTRMASQRQALWNQLASLPRVWRNGQAELSVAGILNVSFDGVDGEALLAAVTGGDNALAVSSGSACASAGAESSYVLRAMGRSPALAGASLRFSLGRFSRDHEIDAAAAKVAYEVARLRALSPRWMDVATVTARAC